MKNPRAHSQRTRAGQADALSRGVKLGRPRVHAPETIARALQMLAAGSSLAEAGAACGVSRQVVRYWARRPEGK